MTEFIVQDAFYITGRGYVLTINLPIENEGILGVGDTIAFDDEEQYVIVGIERARLLLSSMPYSPNVGINIRGELQFDKNSYFGRKFKKVE